MAQKRRRRRKKRTGPINKRNLVLNILIGVFSLVFVIAAGNLGYYYYQSYRSQSAFGDLTKQIPSTSSNELNADGILMDFEAIFKQNKDFIGWLKIDGTAVDYPVMYTPNDPEHYLRLNFAKKWDIAGTPFLDTRSSLNPNSTNLMIYGHDMKDGSMFGGLNKYRKQDYYNGHRIIEFNTLTEHRKYEIFAAFDSKIYAEDDNVFKYYTFFQANDAKEFDSFVKNVKNLSPYDTGITPQYGEELLTLSTCSSHTEDGRFAVVARRILD